MTDISIKTIVYTTFNLHAMTINFSILDKLFYFELATLSLSDYRHCFDFDALKSFWKYDLINTT